MPEHLRASEVSSLEAFESSEESVESQIPRCAHNVEFAVLGRKLEIPRV